MRLIRAALVALALALEQPIAVRGQPFCADGQEITPGTAFVALQPLLAEVIGEPVECEHAGPQGDLLQLTSTGLAFNDAGSDAPNFTTGAEHWALVSGDLAYWTDVVAEAPSTPPPVAPDAPAAPPAVPPPAPVPPVPPLPGSVLLPWQDTTGDLAQPYLYIARRRCTYAAQAFERASPSAAVVLTYTPNVDDPLDKPNLVRLVLAWPGVAGTRTVAGAVAVAQAGPVAVHWTSFTDRLVQDVILPARPVANRLDEQLSGSGIAMSRDSAGGYVVTDLTNLTRFFVRPPTVTDAGGQTSRATLTWTAPSATIALDPIFLSSAAYPLTVSMTIEFGTMIC